MARGADVFRGRHALVEGRNFKNKDEHNGVKYQELLGSYHAPWMTM